MATVITESLNLIDTAVQTYAQTAFQDLAGPITTVIQAGGVVGLAFIAANAVLAFAPISMSTFIKWAVRYVVILAVATSWDQFLPIYEILTNVPSSVGATLLAATNAPTLNGALDQIVTNSWDLSDTMAEESSLFGISFAGIFMWIMGAIMACVAILVSAIAKIGLAMAVSLAPLFIASALFPATNNMFESWSRMTIAFALIPLALAGVMGAIVGVAQNLITSTANASALADIGTFLVVMLAAIVLMAFVPSLVMSLAGSVVAASSGIREGRQAAHSAMNPLSQGLRGSIESVGRVRAAGREADAVRRAGGTASQVQTARMNGMLQNSYQRRKRHAEMLDKDLEASKKDAA